MIAVTAAQKRALGFATGAAVLIGIYFLRNYFLLIAFAAIVTYVFTPVYRWLVVKTKKPGTSAALTIVISFLAIIIPLTILLFLTIRQVRGLTESLTHFSNNVDVESLLQHAITNLNNALARIGVSYHVSLESITHALSGWVANFGKTLVSGLAASISGVASFVTIIIIYIFVLSSLLKKQDSVISTFHRLNPLGVDISRIYTARMGLMTKAMVKGQFLIALLQGFTDAALLYLAGMHSTFFFFFALLTVLSIIPLGGGIVAIPIGIVMILTGNIWGGLIVLLGHFVIVTNIDNVLRPRLVPKEAQLDPALTILSVFAGVAMFGFLGIIIGPVLMIVIVTTIQLYADVYLDIELGPHAATSDKKRSWLDHVKFWDKPATKPTKKPAN